MAADRTPAQQAQLAAARKRSIAWHSTPEGRQAAKRAAEIGWEQRQNTTITCTRPGCGNEFQTPYPDRAKYCSDNCSRAVREKAHKLDVLVTCPMCTIVFWQNKYKKTPTTCSRICGQRLRRQSQER